MGNVPFLVLYNLGIPRFLRSFVGWASTHHLTSPVVFRGARLPRLALHGHGHGRGRGHGQLRPVQLAAERQLQGAAPALRALALGVTGFWTDQTELK